MKRKRKTQGGMNTEEDKEEEPLSLTWLVWNERFAYNINTHVYFLNYYIRKGDKFATNQLQQRENGSSWMLNEVPKHFQFQVKTQRAAIYILAFCATRNTKRENK